MDERLSALNESEKISFMKSFHYHKEMLKELADADYTKIDSSRFF